MIKRTWNGQSIQIHLSPKEIDTIYEMQKRSYWEDDFVNRCIDRKLDGIGLCNLPYETLAEDELLLSTGYAIYQKKVDCNMAYNDILDQVIDLLEAKIALGSLTLPNELGVTA